MNLTSRTTLFLARLLLAPLGLLLSAETFAVSLGDELILSRLGDPVEVEVEVLQWEDMDLDRVQISAASREEYDVFKLTWLPVLEHLNFNLIGPDLNGNVRVLISSRDPLDEPFLELLLVLRWPGGSLRREYVLLFDPPGAPVALMQPAAPEPEPAQAEPEPAFASRSVPVVANVVQEPVQEPALVVSEPMPVVSELAEPTVEPQPDEPETPVTEPQPRVVAFVAPEPSPPLAEVVEQETPEVEAPPPAAQLAEVVEEATPEVETPPAAAPVVQPQPERIAAPPPIPLVSEPVVAEPAPEEAEPEVAAPEVAAPAAVAEAPAPEPDARTQVAIDVETLAPQAAAIALDTTRRTYQVRSGDGLWNIARQFVPAGASENIYQMLLGIHDLNRNSFINGNISLLKANALLQVPTEADIAAIDPATAQDEFDRRWDEGTQRFDAAERGEAIPLFANETAVDEPVVPIEPELPPGTEAPRPAADDGGLIMVSATNTPLPLQLVPAGDVSSAPDSLAMRDEPSVAPTTSTMPAEPAPAAIGTVQDAPVTSAPQAVTTQAPAVTTASVITTTAELETEVAAMRARREAAEAVARQLQESLQRAQAERAAQTDLLAPQNLPLAAGALALIAALVAGVVFMLKVAGELRGARINNDGAFNPRRPVPTRLDAAPVNPARAEPARTEPTWMEPRAKAPEEPRDPRDPAQIEVVEMEPEAANAAAASSDDAADPDDLFARMDNMLGATQKSPQK